MKKSTVVVGFAVVACGLALTVWGRPSHLHVERTIRIAAPASVIFPFLEDFDHWAAWTPWRQLTTRCSDARAGVGAWCGGGAARLTIVRMEPGRRVDYTLEFPGQTTGSADVAIELVPLAGDTDVTWSFDASTAFTDEAFGMFYDVDARLGHDFERGLERLSAATQAAPETNPVAP